MKSNAGVSALTLKLFLLTFVGAVVAYPTASLEVWDSIHIFIGSANICFLVWVVYV